MDPAAPPEPGHTPAARTSRDETAFLGAPPELTRSFIIVLAAAATLAALLIMFSQPDKRLAAPAALGYLALAIAAAACSRAPKEWLGHALGGIMLASLGVIGYGALQLDWGLAAPAFPLLPLMVCILGTAAGWRAGVGLALAASLMVLAVAWVSPTPVAPPGWPTVGLRLASLVLAIAFGALCGAALSRLLERALHSAHRREQRFQRLLALAADVYWEIDADYKLVAAGLHDLEPRSFTLNSGLGKLPWALPGFECDTPTLALLLTDLGARAPFRDLPFAWRYSDGKRRTYLASGEPRRDARGVFKGYWGVARDTSAIEAARTEVQATETRYQELFGHIPTPLVLHRHGRVIDANPAAVRLFGHADLDSMLGTDLLAAYEDPDSRGRARRRSQELQAMPEGVALPMTQYRLSVQGKPLAVQATGVRVRVQGGPALLAIYVDMSERLVAEEALRRSEAMLKHLVATSPDLITLSDMSSGRYAMVNQAFERLTGHPAADAVGRTSLELGIWGSEAAREQFVTLLRDQGAVADLAVSFVSKSGQQVPLLVSAARFEMEQRDYLVINARDISASERHRLEREAILDNASVGIAVTRDQTFVLANRHFERIYGWAPGEMIGQSGQVVWLNAQDYGELGRSVGPALARGEAVQVERSGRRKDGSPFLAQVRGRAIDPTRPAQGGTVWIVEDVTERRQSELALARARDDAEAANRAKSAFLANTSHELRTPLNGMIGLARMACANGVSEVQRQQYLDQIADSAQSLAAIISDILDLSKIEAGKLQIERAPFDLVDLLRVLEHTYRMLATARGLELVFEVDPALRGSVSGDALRLRQIVTNFLANAIKFTESGRVRVHVHRAGNDAVRFEVSDTGPGIAESALGGLFKPFTQGDQSTTRRFGGTGLGLSICHELATLMGGVVGVHSVLGQGSCFWAELPLPPGAALPLAAAPAADGSLAGMRVLMVEDNAVNMLIAVAMLEHWGVQVTQAADGREAIAAVQHSVAVEQPFEAVLMDVQMPVMSGYEATRALRELPAGRGLPILALTAAALVTERDAALAAGMDDFLTKPIDAAKLRSALLRCRLAD